MSNEDLPHSAELASAYLDGELAEHERATAAADPAVMAAAESFTQVRAALGDVGPVDVRAKDAAIAAALAEFDALHAAAGATTVTAAAAAAPVVSLQSRRHRTFRIVTGAAAAAIVVVVAVAALNSTGGDNDLSTSSATIAPAVASESTPELKSLTNSAAATEAAPPAATDAAASGAVADSAEATLPVINTEAQLTAYAASQEIAATTAAPAATLSPADTTAAGAAPNDQAAPAPGGYAAVVCLSSEQVIIGAIVYQGIPAYAVRNTATGALEAIADTDCRVLDEVESP